MTVPHRPAWEKTARGRRFLFLILILVPTFLSTRFMAQLLPHKGGNGIEAVLVLLFGVLFAWISTGFWTALLGFFALTFRRAKPSVHVDTEGPLPSVPKESRTAILVPIYNENVDRVFADRKSVV